MISPLPGYTRTKNKQKNNGRTFMQSLLTSLPFTTKSKETQSMLKRVNRPTFFVTEKQRVNEIQKLVKEGSHTTALKQLIKDTDVENPIQYYRKLKNSEDRESNSCEKGDEIISQSSNLSKTIRPSSCASQTESEPPKTCEEDIGTCQWTGYTRNLDQLICCNAKFKHPWKKKLSVVGRREVDVSDKCIYHQKYCIDERKEHGSKMISISIPNEFGLCSECHVLKIGYPPIALSHYPGQRRRYKVNHSQSLKSRLLVETVDGMQDDKSSLRINDDRTIMRRAAKMSRTVATRIIVQNLSKKVTRIRNTQKYKLERLQNSAAVQIQAFFLYCRLKKIVHKKKYESDSRIISHQTIKLEYKAELSDLASAQIPSTSPRSYSTFGYCHPCNPSRPLKQIVLRGEHPEIERDDQKCDVTACQLCYSRKRNILSGRPISHSLPARILPNLSDEIEKLQRSFKQLDRFELGSLPRNKMLNRLELFWKKVGQPMLPQETQSIVNAFECRDGRDGHIDYIKYLRFASRQSHPCSIHSRIVCPHEKCINRSRCATSANCLRFKENPLDPIFCLCGKYKSRHEPYPLKDYPEARKRGFKVFSHDDLKRVFGRGTIPDTKHEIEFIALDKIPLRYSAQAPHTPNQESNFRKPSSFEKGQENMLILRSPAIQFCENSLPASVNARESVSIAPDKYEQTKVSNGTFITNTTYAPASPIKFSPDLLASMMDQCVKYRNMSKESKPTTSCPLCKVKFFDINLLQDHLIRRHTLQEIDFHLQKYNGYTIDHDKSQQKVRVEWLGKFQVVPPLPSPVPLELCYHHVPPHPKCKICKNASVSTPLYPPIRFYNEAFMELRMLVNKHGDESNLRRCGDEKEAVHEKISNYHLKLGDEQNGSAVVFQEGNDNHLRTGHLVALCEDGRDKSYIGVRSYYQSTDSPTHEWFMESEVNFIEMKKIVGRRYVFHCHEKEFTKIKEGMASATASTKVITEELKYCQFMLKEDTLIPIPSINS